MTNDIQGPEASALRLILIGFVLATLVATNVALAEDEPDSGYVSSWYVQGGAYLHYDEEDDYEGPPLFLGVEYHQAPKLLWGFSMFQNSFGQFSQYAYIGRKFHPWDSYPNLHIKLTGGIVQGYRGENHSTLPIRWGDSWGLGGIPTIGYQNDRFGADLAFLKESGVLFLAGFRFE